MVKTTKDSTDYLNFALRNYGYAITGLKQLVSNVIIPHFYSDGPVVELASGSFSKQDIVSIFIPYTVSYLASDVFNSCKMLEYVIFEENSLLTKLDIRVFAFCSALKFLDIPSTLQTIVAYTNTRLIYSVDSLTCISYLGNKSFQNSYFIQDYNENLKVHVLPSYSGVFGHFQGNQLTKDGKSCREIKKLTTKPSCQHHRSFIELKLILITICSINLLT